MKKYLMMLAAGLLTASLGGCAVVTDSSQTDSVEVEEVAEEAKDDTEKNDTEQEGGTRRDVCGQYLSINVGR